MSRTKWNNEHRHDTLIRMFDLLRTLNRALPGGATIEELAETAQTSTRNVRRYLHALTAAGIEVERVRDGCSRWRLKRFNACPACGHVDFLHVHQPPAAQAAA
jgi:predicted DNA-binding transcriptional regulator YafY